MMPAKKKPSLAVAIGLSKAGPNPKNEHEDIEHEDRVEENDGGAYGDAMTEFMDAVHAKDVHRASAAYGVLHRLEATKPEAEEGEEDEGEYKDD